jgi:hypothetical protein
MHRPMMMNRLKDKIIIVMTGSELVVDGGYTAQ